MKRGAVLALALASCHGGCSGANDLENSNNDAAPNASSIAALGDATVLSPARCTAISKHAAIGSPVDVGEAVTTRDSFAIGLLREKNIFSVAITPFDLASVTFADIGPARGEAAPPLPFLWDNSVYVAWIDSGALRIGRVADGTVALIVDEAIDVAAYLAKEPTSDIPAFDVAVSADHGVVVWDYANPSGGMIRRLAFSKAGAEKGDGGSAYGALSPTTSDADSPRLAPRKGGGFWAIWVAHKPESTVDASAIEGPGESPTYRWLEAVPLDARGNRVGDVVRLTPTLGHVAGYDVSSTAELAQIVVRDATESPDDGTTLSRILLSDKPASPELVASDIGRAVPDVLGVASGSSGSGSIAWVVAPDLTDSTRIVPLSAPSARLESARLESARLESASVEPLLKSSRGLALRWTESGGQLLVLRVASGSASGGPNPNGPQETAEIAVVSCGR